MLRELITTNHTVENYFISADMKRGTVVVKNLSTSKADKASDIGVGLYLLDFDFQPTGYQSEMEISDYTDQADIVKANTVGLLIKPLIGEQYATDQINQTGLVAGDYLVAGATTDVGKLVKATTGKTSILQYQGIYMDGTNTLYKFEVVEPKTL